MNRGMGDRGGGRGRGDGRGRGQQGPPFRGGRGGRGRGTFSPHPQQQHHQPPFPNQPGRGGFVPRGGFRGRGRGRPTADFTEVAFDYSSLTARALGFVEDEPEHVRYAERAFPTNQRPYRPPAPQQQQPQPSTFGASDRGRAGGLGFHRPAQLHQQQQQQPIPQQQQRPAQQTMPKMTFVKAKTAHGFEMDKQQPGDLEDQIDDGHAALSKALSPPQIVAKIEMTQVERATESLSIEQEQFVIDTTPAAIVETNTSSSTNVLGVVLGEEQSKGKETSVEETSEGEEIVFKPQRAVSVADPVPAKKTPTVNELLEEAEESSEVGPPQSQSTKLTKAQKRKLKNEGKKARRKGVLHTRSGNIHLGRNDDIDVDDMLDDDLLVPREGSDIDWGSDGPPPGTGHMNSKQRRKARRAEQRERDKLDRLAANARRQVDEALQADAEDDYAANLLGGDVTVEELKKNVAAVQRENQKTIEEADAVTEDDVEGWHTTSDSDDSSESGSGSGSDSSSESYDTGDEVERDFALGEADARVELILAEDDSDSEDSDLSTDSSFDSDAEGDELIDAMLAGEKLHFQSMGKGVPGGGRKGKKEQKRQKKGKGKAVYDDDSDGDSSSDEEMFDGSQTWLNDGDSDDDYLGTLQDIIDRNAELLDGNRDRKSRKKLFKAIENGDFDDLDDDVYLPKKKGKGKKKELDLDSDEEFIANLQEQWDQDRAKKSAFKRARAEARAAKQGTKKQRKLEKKKQKEGQQGRPTDAESINAQMRHFIMNDIGSSEFALPPMSKKSRVAVHLLAEVYGLKSKSIGKGSARFPMLERTTRTTVAGVSQKRIDAIVGTASGEYSMSRPKAKGKMGGLWAALVDDGSGKKRSSSGRAGPSRHSEGHVVGQGADKIGQDNVGYALLKKMGWTEGGQIGLSGGLADPIAARIKTTRSGLGSGYALGRQEAQTFVYNSNTPQGWD